MYKCKLHDIILRLNWYTLKPATVLQTLINNHYRNQPPATPIFFTSWIRVYKKYFSQRRLPFHPWKLKTKSHHKGNWNTWLYGTPDIWPLGRNRKSVKDMLTTRMILWKRQSNCQITTGHALGRILCVIGHRMCGWVWRLVAWLMMNMLMGIRLDPVQLLWSLIEAQLWHWLMGQPSPELAASAIALIEIPWADRNYNV